MRGAGARARTVRRRSPASPPNRLRCWRLPGPAVARSLPFPAACADLLVVVALLGEAGAAEPAACLACLQAEMARFSGMQYCKTDLIATKGIVFVKYAKSSSACLAMETIQETGMVRGPGLPAGGAGALVPPLLAGASAALL